MAGSEEALIAPGLTRSLQPRGREGPFMVRALVCSRSEHEWLGLLGNPAGKGIE